MLFLSAFPVFIQNSLTTHFTPVCCFALVRVDMPLFGCPLGGAQPVGQSAWDWKLRALAFLIAASLRFQHSPEQPASLGHGYFFDGDGSPARSECLENFPELMFYQSCIIIGNIPLHVNVESLFTLLHDAFLWKMNSSKVISDPKKPQMKAVVFAYENEMVARLCAFRISKAVENSSLSLYEGISLFLHCKKLEQDCDPRSKHLTVSGLDHCVPKDMYLKLFQSLGSMNYYEFCLEGEIPNIRIEYKRLTSSMAALICLKSTMGKDAIIAMETPLFQVPQIAPGREKRPVSRKLGQFSEIMFHTDDVFERYSMCFMNTMNYQYPNELVGNGSNGGHEDIQEGCSMRSLSFEICRKNSFENLNTRYVSNGMYENTARMNEETLQMLFLQAAKRSSWSLNPSKSYIRYV